MIITLNMSDFNKLCKAVEDMDPATYTALIATKSAEVIAGLKEITGSTVDAVAVFADLVLCSVAADGKLDETEYLAVKPVLDLAFGRDVSYDDAKKIFKMAGLDKPAAYKEVVDEMVDVIGLADPDFKDDIVMVCLLVCAVDGKVSFREKRWIKKLIE